MDANEMGNLIKSLGLENTDHFILIKGSSLLGCHCLPFAPDQFVLITDICSQDIINKIVSLMKNYPKDHSCKITHQTSHSGWLIAEKKYSRLDKNLLGGHLYIPPALADSSLESFKELIAHLRSSEGCPWDREQTHLTLRPNLLEETYEVLSALDQNSMEDLKEELGDLLLQIVLHTQISDENEDFNLNDVIAGIHNKLVLRHPHVFEDVKIESAKGVIRNWEMLKSVEREGSGKEEKQSIIASVPVSMPALSLAQEYQKRAARVGFDWPSIEPVLEKVYEELEEVKHAKTATRIEEELGDLLFAVVNLVRWHEVDAESTLRKMNQRFYRRFNYIEQKAKAKGQKLQEMTLAEMDDLWDQAKMANV